MTQEQIEKAADKYAEAHDVEPYDEYGSGIRIGARFGFIAGAKWRIDSVWHNPNEIPRRNKMLLTISGDFNTFICGPHTEDWPELVQDFNILKWAYVEDLVPDSLTQDRLESRKKERQQAMEYLEKQEMEMRIIEQRRKEGKSFKTQKQISKWLQEQPWYESFRRQIELSWAHMPGAANKILDGKDLEKTLSGFCWDFSPEGHGFWEKVDYSFLNGITGRTNNDTGRNQRLYKCFRPGNMSRLLPLSGNGSRTWQHLRGRILRGSLRGIH